MSFEYLSDQSIIRYCEEIRKLADDDRQAKRRLKERDCQTPWTYRSPFDTSGG
jgi:hypothetical protein